MDELMDILSLMSPSQVTDKIKEFFCKNLQKG